jgi:hypothetical protein
MKVLFLDIDGVLNCESTKEKVGGNGPYRSMHGLDTRLLKLFLDWLRAHPEVMVVLSSTWRLEPEMVVIIDRAGIPLVSATRNLRNRREEIDDFLRRGPGITHYAILDDIAQFSAAQQPHFVQTSYVHGLRDKDLRRVEGILGLKEETDGLVA